MNKTKTMRIGFVIFGVTACILLVIFILPRLLILFLPFILAYLLAKFIEPFVRFLHTRLKLPRAVGAIIGIVLALGIIGTVLGMVLNRLWKECNEIVAQSDIIIRDITNRWNTFQGALSHRFGLAEAFSRYFEGFGRQVSDSLASYTMPAIRSALGVVKSLPSGIVFAVVFFISAYFMSSDRDTIVTGMRRIMPVKAMAFMENTLHNVFKALGAYIKAQMTMICITFLELTIGFLIVGGAVADYALLMALVISIIDAIPILGTGTVLIPWAVFAFFTGDARLGILLLVLYLICLAVRQMIEPRLVARQIGLHPLLVLMVMYVGLRFIGIFGMLLGPVLALVVKQLGEAGVFRTIGRYIEGKNA